MKEAIVNALKDYAHRQGGSPVNLTDPAVAAEVADAVLGVLEAATAPDPAA